MKPFKGLAMAILTIVGIPIIVFLFVLLNFIGPFLMLGIMIVFVIFGVVKEMWNAPKNKPEDKKVQQPSQSERSDHPSKSVELWGDIGWDDSGDSD